MSTGSHGACLQDSCRLPADSSTAVQSQVTAQQGYDAANNTLTADVTSSTGKCKHWVSQTILFIQLNLHHCQPASALLTKQIAQLDTVVAVVQEPWTNKGQILGLQFKGCYLFRGTNGNNPRTCILTKGIHAMCLPQFGDRDITTISITYTAQNKERTVIISSVYMAMEDQPPPSRLEQLVQHCMDNNIPLIVACDTNSHHPFWGSSDTNPRGTVLSEYIATTNLEVANRGSEPTFCAGNRRTVIDVTDQ